MTTETTTQTIHDFLEKYPVAITLVEVPENPQMGDSKDKMINYYVTLEREGRMMSLYFSTGLGWVEKLTTAKGKGWNNAIGNAHYDKKHKRFLVTEHRNTFEPDSLFPRYRIRKPSAADILDCLSSDACGIEQSFEDWASDLGYDTDSRKAFDTYQTCQRQAKELRSLLGREAFNELLYQTERL